MAMESARGGVARGAAEKAFEWGRDAGAILAVAQALPSAAPHGANVIDLATLTRDAGFKILGPAERNFAGLNVGSTQDFNGDGFNDLFVSSTGYDGSATPGVIYVVFLHGSDRQDEIDLADLKRAEGLKIVGHLQEDSTFPTILGAEVSSAGDINGDGFSDIVVSSPYYLAGTGHDVGTAYVIYGTDSGPGQLDVTDLNGENGFRIMGGPHADIRSVSTAGDMNGDGLDDIVVSGAGYGGTTGSAYVVFGRSDGFGSEVDPAHLARGEGFVIPGKKIDDFFGTSVSSAGDFNGDGFNDVIIGAVGEDYFSGASYIIYGKSGGFDPVFKLKELSPTDGLVMHGPDHSFSGRAVAAAGDVNGDGYDDVLVGTNTAESDDPQSAGAVFVVFGSEVGSSASLDLEDLTPDRGFKVVGPNVDAFIGTLESAIAGAGDFNGDGYDDILISSAGLSKSSPGSAWLIFGKSSGFGATVDLASLGINDGIRLFSSDDVRAGYGASTAGDVNGDGFDDILVGSSFDSENGDYSGAAYVIYGHATKHLNEPPSGQDATRTIAEDTPYTLKVSDFGFSDPDGDEFAGLVFPSSVPKNAIFLLDGQPFGPIAVMNISLIKEGRLAILPNADGNGNGYASLTFKVMDDGGIDGGGQNTDPSPNTLTFNVTPVDDAPVAVADAAAVRADRAASLAVLANDRDIDGGPKTIARIDGRAVASGESVKLASGATVTLNATGTLAYDPNHAFDTLAGSGSGAVNTQTTDVFAYSLNGGSSAAVTVTVTGVTDAKDRLLGDARDDTLHVTGPSALIDGGDGFDRLIVDRGATVEIAPGGIANIERIVVERGATLDLHRLDDPAAATKVVSHSTAVEAATISGSRGDDELRGGAGADTLLGGAGDDVVRLSAAPAHVDGGSGRDLLVAAAGSALTFDAGSIAGFEGVRVSDGASVDLSGLTDGLRVAAGPGAETGVRITGTQDGDILTGGAGDDVLAGGGGRDVLSGGHGADTFVFSALGDFPAHGLDEILDFSRNDADRIDLSGLLGGTDVFTFIGSDRFGVGGTAFELRAELDAGGRFRVSGDLDHDGAADFTFLVHASFHQFVAADFVGVVGQTAVG